MMRPILLALAVLAASACTQATTPPGTPAEQPAAAGPQTAEEATAQDACGASRFGHLIGVLASEIDQGALPEGTRVITPDMMVTQDFRPERLNVITGTDGRVSSLSCF
jgi:hypothetical protein